MKTFLILFVLTILKMEATTLFAQQQVFALRQPHVPTGVFIPKGYDSNDTVEIFVMGELENLCFKNPRVHAENLGNSIKIKLTVDKLVGELYCPQLITPFELPVTLYADELDFAEGLQRKSYPVWVNDQIELKLDIEKSPTVSKDSANYARVTTISKFDSQKVVINGFVPGDCFKFEKSESENFHYEVNGEGNTLSILPTLSGEFVEGCSEALIPFTRVFTIPEAYRAKKLLLHVRSMGGISKNYFWE